MDVLYFNKSGRVKKERVKSNVQYFEGPDGGFYCAQPEGALKDRKHKNDALMMFFQDVPTPLNGDFSNNYFDKKLLDIHMHLKARKKVPGISLAIVRAMWAVMAAIGSILVKYGVALMIIGLFAYALFGEKLFGV